MDSNEVKWHDLVEAAAKIIQMPSNVEELRVQFADAVRRFVSDSSMLEYVRRGLRGSVIEVMTALEVVSEIAPSDRVALFPEILRLCMVQKFRQSAGKFVLSMPREWIKSNIRDASRPFVADNLDYLMFLGLCSDIDLGLALEVAKEAAKSSDADIREVGEDFLAAHGKEGEEPGTRLV